MLRLSVTGEYQTLRIPDDYQPDVKPRASEWEDVLDTVWDRGRLLKDQTFAEVRARAG